MESKKYQVFLSSTYADLIDEREGIIKAILEMYHIPIGMEMFSAEDEDQWEIIRRTIEVSDYYILILGLRYGSKTSDNISFTQKEYEYALEKKIPILAFVMNDAVSLSKDKRDDDLSEIVDFRNKVLKNSRMAQFWETKDELIKNVSISLMKQIMQKPGVGWVRGDRVAEDESLLKELSALSKENRELREKIEELESKVSLKIPFLSLGINSPVIDEAFNSCARIEIPNVIEFKDVDKKLLEYVSRDDVDKYNDSLPSQSQVDEYNDECERIYKIEKYSTPLIIEVCNEGSAKANNIFIDIEFPEGILIYENDKEHRRPMSPIPFNPVVRAQEKYDKKQINENLSFFRSGASLGFGGHFPTINSIKSPVINVSSIKPINRHWWTRLDERKITIKIDDLLHTRMMIFDDEYMIVALESGRHLVKVDIICEEYGDIQTQIIEINV